MIVANVANAVIATLMTAAAVFRATVAAVRGVAVAHVLIVKAVALSIPTTPPAGATVASAIRKMIHTRTATGAANVERGCCDCSAICPANCCACS